MGITDIVKDIPAIFNSLENTFQSSFLNQNHLSMVPQTSSMYVIYTALIVIGGKPEEMNWMIWASRNGGK